MTRSSYRAVMAATNRRVAQRWSNEHSRPTPVTYAARSRAERHRAETTASHRDAEVTGLCDGAMHHGNVVGCQLLARMTPAWRSGCTSIEAAWYEDRA